MPGVLRCSTGAAIVGVLITLDGPSELDVVELVAWLQERWEVVVVRYETARRVEVETARRKDAG